MSLPWLLMGITVLVTIHTSVHPSWGHEAKAPYREAVQAYSQNRDAEALIAFTAAKTLQPTMAEAFYHAGEVNSRSSSTCT